VRDYKVNPHFQVMNQENIMFLHLAISGIHF